MKMLVIFPLVRIYMERWKDVMKEKQAFVKRLRK